MVNARSLSGIQVSEPRRGQVVDVSGPESVTLAPWPTEATHPLGIQIRTWIQSQLEEDPEFVFSYEDSPFQVGQAVG